MGIFFSIIFVFFKVIFNIKFLKLLWVGGVLVGRVSIELYRMLKFYIRFDDYNVSLFVNVCK